MIPRLVLARLIEESKTPPPTTFVVTIRTDRKPLPPAHHDDFLAEEAPSIVIPLPEDAPHVASRTYATATRIATVLVACAITLGACLVVGMLFS